MPETTNRVGARRTAPGGVKQKYFLTPECRQLILDRYDGSSARITELQKILRVPRAKVTQWAHDMGLARTTKRWTQEEIDFLKKNIRKMPLIEIAKHLNKANNTIRRKAHSLGLYKKRQDEYTLADLATAFGNDERTIRQWVEKGWLKGKKGKTQVSFETWQFSVKNIREFIFSHPDRLNPHKFDWLWIADILSGYGIGRLDEDKYAREEEE